MRECMGKAHSISSEKAKQEAFYTKRTKDTKYLLLELNQIGHNRIAFVHRSDKNPFKKINLDI